MIAILEMPVPYSCSECEVSQAVYASEGGLNYCPKLKEIGSTSSRLPNCPLKIVPDEIDVQHLIREYYEVEDMEEDNGFEDFCLFPADTNEEDEKE